MLKNAKLLYRYVQGLIGLKKEDVIFTSYPKSGNTWVRFFFCNLINSIHLNNETVDHNLVDKVMPELGTDQLINTWGYKPVPRIVKTHKNYSFIFNSFRSIFLFRDPRDVMVSYYKFETARKQGRFKGSFSNFIRHRKFGLESWFKHYISWESKSTVTVKYEDLKKNDIQEFRRIIKELQINIDDDLICKAVKDSRFENLKKIEKTKGQSKKEMFQKDYNFMRKGMSGTWEDFFDKQDFYLLSKLEKEYEIQVVD